MKVTQRRNMEMKSPQKLEKPKRPKVIHQVAKLHQKHAAPLELIGSTEAITEVMTKCQFVAQQQKDKYECTLTVALPEGRSRPLGPYGSNRCFGLGVVRSSYRLNHGLPARRIPPPALMEPGEAWRSRRPLGARLEIGTCPKATPESSERNIKAQRLAWGVFRDNATRIAQLRADRKR